MIDGVCVCVCTQEKVAQVVGNRSLVGGATTKIERVFCCCPRIPPLLVCCR